MSHLAQFLKLAFPHIPADLADAAAAEASKGGAGGVSQAVHDDALETIEMYRKEIGLLNNEIVRHKDGIQNATKAGLDVLGERARQRRLEGYDDAHDDEHDDYSLSAAAIAYLTDARLRASTGKGFDHEPPVEWPWSEAEWKPKGIRKSLVVAAALILAEIERYDRAGGCFR